MNLKRRHPRYCLLLALILVLSCGARPHDISAEASPPNAARPAVPSEISAAQRRLVKKLMALNRWAADRRISGFRHRVFRLILSLDSDHKIARKVLKFNRTSKDAPWRQDKKYKAPPNWSRTTLIKADERLRATLGTFRDDVLTQLERLSLPPGQNDRWLESLIDLLPNDATLRAETGSVRQGDRWVLEETAAADKRRAAICQKVIELTRAVLADGLERDAKELAKGWDSAWSTQHRTASGTHPDDVVRSTVLHMAVADRLCDDLLGDDEKRRGPLYSIILKNREEARTLLKRESKWTKHLFRLDKVSGFAPESGVFLSYRRNQDMVPWSGVRRVVDSGLGRKQPGKERGWITEGVGQRICWYVGARHGPAYVLVDVTQSADEEEAEDDELPDDANTWLRAAAAVLTRDGPERLVAVLTKNLNAMRTADVLVAYGLAAYLIEARPEAFISFLAASSERHDVQAMIEETLGAPDAGVLTWRLRRWLLEHSNSR